MEKLKNTLEPQSKSDLGSNQKRKSANQLMKDFITEDKHLNCIVDVQRPAAQHDWTVGDFCIPPDII